MGATLFIVIHNRHTPPAVMSGGMSLGIARGESYFGKASDGVIP